MLLFFDLGAGEILLIIIVVVVVFGPKQLPEMARNLGKAINEMKRASSGFKDEINKEVQRIDREERLQEFTKLREKSIVSSDNMEVDQNVQTTTETISRKQNSQ
jgi:Tat protein translocase TatB subunit